MAEKESEEKVPSSKQVQEKVVVMEQKKSSAGLVFSIINLILILALAAGGFYLLQEMKDEQAAQSDDINKDDLRNIETSKQFNAFQSQLATMQSQIATTNEEITGKDNHFTKTLADFSRLHTEKLENVHKNLEDEITQLKRQLGKTRGDWLIADAEYLLSVANQRLHLMGDITTTRMALEAADQRLRESGDAAAFKVRAQIAKEIADLRTVELPDIVGIYASIQLLKDKVDKLAMLLPYADKPLTEAKEIHQHEETQEDSHGVLNSALQALEGYVTVRHSDQPVTEILTEQDVAIIRQQLNIKLEMMKIALVQQHDFLYKKSIADSRQWLKNHFTRNSKFNSFMDELDKLDAIQIRGHFPDISQSLKMLKDITKLRIETDKALQDSDDENEQSTNNTVSP